MMDQEFHEQEKYFHERQIYTYSCLYIIEFSQLNYQIVQVRNFYIFALKK